MLGAVAERDGAGLVFADRFQYLAERRIDRPHDDGKTEQEHRQHEVVHRQRLVQIDQAEQIAARHRLDAVLTTGELRLQTEKEHHLRESQRDHREIDPRAADREIAEHQAERRRDRDAGEDAEVGRHAPYLDGMRGDVGRAAEERGVTERQEADIAEQQVEGAGEQRHAQRLHDEDRIEKMRRRDCQRDQPARPQPDSRRAALAMLGSGEGHAARPNRPAGLISSTSAMITKMTVADASG